MRTSPFLVNIADLRRRGVARRSVQCRGPLDDLEVLGTAVPPGGEVAVEATVEAVPGGAVVSATVEAPWAGQCRRCAGEAAGVVRAQVRELFEEHPDPEQTYPLHGDQLDLEPMARDTVLLELPLAPLCAEECQGLCPHCGADLNVGECGCQPEQDPRWAALDALRDS